MSGLAACRFATKSSHEAANGGRIGPEGEALGRPVTAAQPSFEQWAEATELPDVRRVGMRTLYTDYDPFGHGPGGNAGCWRPLRQVVVELAAA